MDLDRPSTRRFLIYLLVVTVLVLALLWFIPAVTKATQKAPVHSEIGLDTLCADDPVVPPDYGNRDPVSLCSN
jgi:hypothetical protein